MATDPAPASRNLWQLPTFLLGAAALVAVWYGRPYWQQSPAQRYERDLAALREALDKSPVDAPKVQELLRKVHGVEPPPHLEKAAPYVIGSALAVSAEVAATPDEADEQLRAARRLLEQADRDGVPEPDRARLKHRLAKVWARTGEPPLKVVDALTATLDCGDDPAEANRLLADALLKLDPPDNKKARDCLKEYLARVGPGRGEGQARALNQARLQLGDLLTKLGEPDEARKVLERIGPDAPPEVLVAARAQLARSHQAEEDWAPAIRCLEQARDVRGITPAQKAAVLFQLSECYAKVSRRAEAIAALEQVRKAGGPAATAAALRLAEFLLADPKKREEAVLALEGALPEDATAETYRNPLLTLTEARAIYEEAALKFRAAGAFDAAVRAARASARVAEPGRDRELAAEALQAWGQALLEQAPQAEPEDRPRLVEEGTKHVREAAGEWQQVAAVRKSSAVKGAALCKAADLFLKAGEQEEALKALDELGLKVPDYPVERMAEVWLKKGEVYLALGNREQARLCFHNGAQAAEGHPSPALLQCRLRLAELLARGGDPKALAHAAGELEQALADPELTRDRALHEAALLFVADAHYQLKDYRKAEVRFRMFLDGFPDSPKTVAARFQLGQSYWFIAGQEADKCKAAKKVSDDPASPDDRKREAGAAYEESYRLYMEWLKKAAEPFKAVEAQLLRSAAGTKLPPAEAELLRKASLAAADCAFFSGDYEDSVARYDAIAERYAGTVVQLEALRSMWRCYQYYLQKPDKAADTVTQMRTVFVQMPEAEFDGSSDVRKRLTWQKWFETVAPMKK
jgi:hypothetical protein